MLQKLFQVYFCVYLLWQQILSSFLLVLNLPYDGMIMRVALVILFVISSIFYQAISPRYSIERKIIAILVVFGLLLYSTQFFYDGNKQSNYMDGSRIGDLFIGVVLRWGADCVPGCLLGITLVKLNDYSVIHKTLPIITTLLTPLMAYTTFYGALQEGLHIAQGGFDYQNMAYYMAFLFCVSFYYAFIHKGKISIFTKAILIIFAAIQLVSCFMAGGRGGVVLLVLYLAYLGYLILSKTNISIIKLVISAIVCVLIVQYIADSVGLMDSEGFSRSSGLLQDDDRILMWKSIWHFVEDNSYIGYGFGGDYFTYGFYTHNIILDFILETGILGAICMIIIFIKMTRRLYSMTFNNDIYIVVFIFYLYGLVMNMFSGYWINTPSHWVVLGLTMTFNYICKLQKQKI